MSTPRYICTKCTNECLVGITDGLSICCGSEAIPFGNANVPDPKTCKHENFAATCTCHRDEKKDEDGKVVAIEFRAEVSLQCTTCKSPMSFIGAVQGSGVTDKPHTDQMGLTMVLPFRPGMDVISEFLKAREPVAGDATLSGGKLEEQE